MIESVMLFAHPSDMKWKTRPVVARFQIFIAALFLLAGCANSPGPSPDSNYVITYYDRNQDGIVDVEFHHHRYATDSDWALIDTQFRGHFDLKSILGYARTDTSGLPIAVPRNVAITPGQPPLSIPSDRPPRR